MLITAEIGQLHKELASSYEGMITSRAKDAIKNEAASVNTTDYFQDRHSVEARFRNAIQARWDAKPALHCTLDQFHLGRIKIPDSVAEKQLQSRIQNERNDMEASLQKAAIERELTAVDVNAIYLQKEKLLRTANAAASLLRANARASAARIVQEAQINGTQLLFAAANITNQEHKTAFTYIRTLMNRKDLALDISYLPPTISSVPQWYSSVSAALEQRDPRPLRKRLLLAQKHTLNFFAVCCSKHKSVSYLVSCTKGIGDDACATKDTRSPQSGRPRRRKGSVSTIIVHAVSCSLLGACAVPV